MADSRSDGLSAADLYAAFKRNSPLLVEEMLKQAQRQLDAEDARIVRTDTKASAMLASVGISLSVLTSVGVGALLPSTSVVRGEWLACFCGAVALVSISGLASCACALLAVRVTKHQIPDESVLLSESKLAKVDGAESQEDGLRNYRAWIGAHIWQVFQRNRDVCGKKTRLVRFSQNCFAAMLLCMTLLSGLVMAFIARK